MPSKNPAKNRRARISKNRSPTSSVLLLCDRSAEPRFQRRGRMTEHAMPDTAPNTDLFEIMRTTRSMRRLKPDPRRTHSLGTRLDRPVLGRRDTDPHVRLVHLPRSSEHAAGGTSARPRRDSDDASFAVREGSRGRSGLAAERPFVCLAANRLSDGPLWTRPPCTARRCRL
jgi:hypothetical protein